jgi:hypothetical protein
MSAFKEADKEEFQRGTSGNGIEGSEEKERSFFKAALGYVFLGLL